MNGKHKFDLFIISGFTFLIVLIMISSFIGYTGIKRTKDLFQNTYQTSFQEWIETEQANTDLISLQRSMKDIALSRNDTQLRAAISDMDHFDLRIRDYFGRTSAANPDNALLSDVVAAYNDWATVRTKTVDYAKNGQFDEAGIITMTTDASQVELITGKMQLLSHQAQEEADSAYEKAENATLVSQHFLIWMTLFSAVLAVMMTLFVRRRLLRYQALLFEEKEKLRITLDSIGDGVITADTAGNVLRLNKVAEQFTGWPSAEAGGKPFTEVFQITNAYTGEKARDPIEEVLKTDSICLLDNHTILTSKDGTKRHIADSAAPIKDETGHTSGVVMIFRDVTERKIAEKLLQESEERFRTIFEQAPIGIGLSDPATGRMIEMNDRFSDILGRTKDELKKTDWMSVTHPDDLQKQLDMAAQLNAGRIKSFRLEKRYLRPDASVVWINISVALFSSTEYQTPLHLCMIADITELKNAELALAQSNIKLEATLQSTADGLEALDLEGNFFFFNEQFRLMWRLPEDISRDSTFSFISDNLANRNKALGNVRDLLEQLKVEPFRELALKDGRTFERYAKPILVGGQTTGFVLSYRDISAKKSSEQAIIASESRHKAMIANISDTIAIIDQTGKLQYISPNIEALFGWCQEDFERTSLFRFVHPGDIENVRTAFRELMLARSMKLTLKFKMLCRDEAYRYIKLVAVNMLGDPNIQGILMNFHDISESKKREDEILYLNYHDILTGLYNRAFFEEEMSRLDCNRQLPISVIMGDINGLKLINDAFGHKAGDKLLGEIAKILSSSCRTEDILARTGGDEFCILLPQTTAEEARSICKRIYSECVSYENRTDKGTFYLSISLGHATKEDDGTPVESVLAEAEEYMYKQKLLERKSMRSSLLASIKTTMFEKSHLTAEHEERLVNLAKKIGVAMDLPDGQINELELLSTLHDLGKLSIDDQILNKQGPLTEEEWAEIRKHPEVGFRIAQASPELAPIAEYILCHHERWDGKGYPQGLKGEAIPLLSRIVSVVDAFDAMTQDRPYRRAISVAEAISEITDNAGTQFDPVVAGFFVRVLKDMNN